MSPFPASPIGQRWARRLAAADRPSISLDNQGYGSFDDFLASLNSRKRMALRKERQAVAASGVRLFSLTGDDLKPAHWDAFYRLYRATTDRKWGQAYLTRDFFHRLGAAMPEKLVLILAQQDGAWVGGALNLLGKDTLYGRNWGGRGDIPFLHFEVCYYRAIDFAIERGLKKVEAGAQGEHKIQRGYLPVLTYSAHLIYDPAFRRAVGDFLIHETALMRNEIAMLERESPYRQAEITPPPHDG